MLDFTTIRYSFCVCSLIPRLQELQPCDMPVWVSLLARIHDVAQSGPSVWDTTAHMDIIRSCLERIRTSLATYPIDTTTTRKYTYSYSDTTAPATVDPIVCFLDIGARCDAFDLCMPVLHKMWTDKDAQQTACPERPPSMYYNLLVPRLSAVLQGRPQRFMQALRPFFCQAITVLLPLYSSSGEAFRIALDNSGESIMVLKEKCVLCGLHTLM